MADERNPTVTINCMLGDVTIPDKIERLVCRLKVQRLKIPHNLYYKYNISALVIVLIKIEYG
jgi:hypothetical protein